jgi:hypothetical protein
MLLRLKNGTFKRSKIWETSKEELQKSTAWLMDRYKCSRSVVCQARIAKGLRTRVYVHTHNPGARTKNPNYDGLHEIFNTVELRNKMNLYEENFRIREQNGQLENGNLKIYRAEEHSQEFLRSLIPSNQ